MKPPYHIKDPQLKLMISELYDRMGKVEPAVQKVTDQVSSIRAVVGGTGRETVLLPDGTEVPMQPNIPDGAKIGKGTGAGLAIPSSYFLDLRLWSDTVWLRRITADWLTLHDNSTPWKTLGLASINETNNIDVPGIAGRDQVAAFLNQWIYFFIIYSSTLRATSSLSSLSATAPTLPTNYDYFVRVGASYVGAGNLANVDYQFGNKTWVHKLVNFNMEPAVAGTYQSINISLAAPLTAYGVWGYCGLDVNAGSSRGMSVASELTEVHYYMGTIPAGAIVYTPMSPIYFDLPIVTAQTLYWKGSHKAAIYNIVVSGYYDDI